MEVVTSWELKLSEDFEDLKQQEKDTILGVIISDIQRMFFEGSIGIEVCINE